MTESRTKEEQRIQAVERARQEARSDYELVTSLCLNASDRRTWDLALGDKTALLERLSILRQKAARATPASRS